MGGLIPILEHIRSNGHAHAEEAAGTRNGGELRNRRVLVGVDGEGVAVATERGDGEGEVLFGSLLFVDKKPGVFGDGDGYVLLPQGRRVVYPRQRHLQSILWDER